VGWWSLAMATCPHPGPILESGILTSPIPTTPTETEYPTCPIPVQKTLWHRFVFRRPQTECGERCHWRSRRWPRTRARSRGENAIADAKCGGYVRPVRMRPLEPANGIMKAKPRPKRISRLQNLRQQQAAPTDPVLRLLLQTLEPRNGSHKPPVKPPVQ